MSTISKFSHALCLASYAACAPVTVFAVLPATPVIAAQQVSMEEAISLHNAAHDGDRAAAQQAVDMLLDILKDDPKNAKANVYLGSSYALMARDANNVTDKIRYTNRGLRYLDLAVSEAPEDFTVRLVRMNVCESLPAMFGREKTVREDMIALDGIAGDAPDAATAKIMAPIYRDLEKLAPGQADWAAKADAADLIAAKG